MLDKQISFTGVVSSTGCGEYW